MKTILLVLTILLTSPIWSQNIEFSIGDSKTYMRITAKDTCIYDSMGTIRYLLKAYNYLWDHMNAQEEKLDRLQQVIDNMDGILFYQPKRNRYYKL
jgi:hypothetical protein